jgi:hypothetical protein
MPVIRSFIAKVKPGRMQDAVTQLGAFKRTVLASGATHFAAYNMLTGSHFPALNFNAVFEDLVAFGAGQEKVRQDPNWVPIRDAPDPPIELVTAFLSEPVYMAGNVLDILEQANVRYTVAFKPHRGRQEDEIRRLSQVADLAHQSGALAAGIRNVIAGMDGLRLLATVFQSNFEHFQTTRNAMLASDAWTAVMRSQDESSTRLTTVLSTKIAV